VRRTLGIARVGHAGTLDPPATGLMVVLIGRATRLARFVGLLPKGYLGTIRFGTETTTDDAEGEAIGAGDATWRTTTRLELEAALREVAARTEQLPPRVSAKKVDGVRAWRRVRRGEEPALSPAAVRIHELALGRFDAEAGEADITVRCSSGTYVRAIARDVGRALGTQAHLKRLRRTAIGPWTVEEALPLAALTAESAAQHLRPMREAVAHLPAVILPAEESRRFASGQRIPAQAPPGPVAVFGSDDLVGVADLQDGILHPDVVLVG
jgi:tRNA pseudouridine55 synthase